MQMNITARHDTKASDAIKQRIMAKLQKNESHFDHITNIQVTIDKGKKKITIYRAMPLIPMLLYYLVCVWACQLRTQDALTYIEQVP